MAQHTMVHPGPARRRTPLAPSCAEPHTCAMSVRLRMLAASPVFRDLPESSLADVEQRFRAHGYHRGQVLYAEGTPAQALYVLAAGRVKLSRTVRRGGSLIVDVVMPGQVFGALPALGHEHYRSTATAMVVSCALGIDREAFGAIVAAHPRVATAALATVGAQLETAHAALERLSLDSAEARIAATLLDLADRLGHDRPDMRLLQLPLTRADLAAMAGTTEETASRVLSRWKAAGWVATGRGWVGIVDGGPLRAMLA